MAQFQKGEGGRPKGKSNKATGNLREWVSNFIDNNKEQIQRDWKGLTPKDRIILFEKMLKYVLPTLQTTNLTSDFDKLSEEQLDLIIERLKNGSDDT